MSEMRLQRALAQAGIASRRNSEDLITSGRVRVDGKVAELGSKVDPTKQKITVDGKPTKKVAKRWIALHKPLGVVTTASDEQGRKTVMDLIPNPRGLTYVGRLDINTTGLLLLTTDGDAVHRLTHHVGIWDDGMSPWSTARRPRRSPRWSRSRRSWKGGR